MCHQKEVPIVLKPPIKDYNWPEVVDDNNILLGGQTLESGVFAIPKKEK
jgi:hypothetical protein